MISISIYSIQIDGEEAVKQIRTEIKIKRERYSEREENNVKFTSYGVSDEHIYSNDHCVQHHRAVCVIQVQYRLKSRTKHARDIIARNPLHEQRRTAYGRPAIDDPVRLQGPRGNIFAFLLFLFFFIA